METELKWEDDRKNKEYHLFDLPLTSYITIFDKNIYQEVHVSMTGSWMGLEDTRTLFYGRLYCTTEAAKTYALLIHTHLFNSGVIEANYNQIQKDNKGFFEN